MTHWHHDPHKRMGQLLQEEQNALAAPPAIIGQANLTAARRLMRKAETMLGDAKTGRSAYPAGLVYDLEEIRALADMLVRGLK